MKHDEFIGRVQHYARLPSRGDAERATRATLETLGERLAGGEPKDLGRPAESSLSCESRHKSLERSSLQGRDQRYPRSTASRV